MAKDRERACVYYEHEGSCRKGHKGFFNSTCQHCESYLPARNGNVRRKDLRRQKREAFEKNKKNWF